MRRMRIAAILFLTFFALLTLGLATAAAVEEPLTLSALSQTSLAFFLGFVMLAASAGFWLQLSVQNKLRRHGTPLPKEFTPRSKYAVWTRSLGRRTGKPMPRSDLFASKPQRRKNRP